MVTKIKPMNPKSPDQKYMGIEPQWPVPEGKSRQSAVMSAWHWYSYYYGKKEVKQCIVAWLADKGRLADAKAFARVPENSLANVTGWLCRMEMCGLELEPNEIQHIDEQINLHLEALRLVREVTESVESESMVRPNIQDRLREKMTEAAGEIEGMYDELIKSGSKMTASFKPIAVIRGMNVAPQLINEIKNVWAIRLSEIQTVLEGRDAQLVDGYSNFSKIQLRNLLKFIEQVIADCDSYVQIKKIERKPRAKKAKPPEVIARGFKCKLEEPELKIKGEPAAKLVGASEAWLYDTKKRKLIHAVADTHIGTFTVKGSGLIGLDTGKTLQKTLRKPVEQLKALMSASVPNARKLFQDTKATEVKWSGRSNENLIILRVK